MKTNFSIPWLLAMTVVVMLTGCATKPYDYTNYRAHPPRSILILPPLNESTEIGATYGYLSTVTKPIAEKGYYVFPVAVIDQMMKENGLPTPGEMHQVSLEKIHQIVGADAVLYVTLKQYGTKYQVISSTTIVAAESKLVDVKTGTLIWEGKVNLQQGSSSGNLIVDLIATPINQAVNQSADSAHALSGPANMQMFTLKDHGLLSGPHAPQDTQQ